jgi:hypothetical protein
MLPTRPTRPPRETLATAIVTPDVTAIIFAAAEALNAWLDDRFHPAADFYLTDFCFLCRRLGLTGPEMQRIANHAFRDQRAAEVTA